MSESTSDARTTEATTVSGDDVEATRALPAVTDDEPAAATKTQEPVATKAGASAAAPARPVASRSADQASRTARPARTRKARLRISRIDPWSAMKTSLLFSIAGAIVFWVATYLVWAAIGSLGLFDSINQFVAGLINAPGEQDKFQIQKYISTNKVLGFTALLGFVDVVLLTILGTLASFLYNLAASMLGGLEVTLAED